MSTDSDINYSVVLTSCKRFDLLEKTIYSFFKYADVLPKEFIVIEDSGDSSVRTVLEKIDFPFQVIINSPSLGQDCAIDKAYASVKTPLVFHCEDDWEFTRTGFIKESAILLRAFPSVSCIMLRGRSETAGFEKLPVQECDKVLFFMPPKNFSRKFFGYSYNPGLRRLADFQKIAPVSKIGNEKEVSYLFKCLGYGTAHLESAVVVHLGDERSTQKPIREKIFPFFAKRIKRHWLIAKYLILHKLR